MLKVKAFDPGANTAPLAAVHAACFARAWDAATLSQMIAAPGAFAFAHDDGFVLARLAADEAEILTLAVSPQARRKGLGRALLQAAITQAHSLGAASLFLEVGAENAAARALYAGLGFVNVGMRKGYYAGQDALVLRLPLTPDFA